LFRGSVNLKVYYNTGSEFEELTTFCQITCTAGIMSLTRVDDGLGWVSRNMGWIGLDPKTRVGF